MPRTTIECVYCGSSQEITSDHIPPACLFSRPRPSLITVPSCVSCNRGASLDDEYFRLVVAGSQITETVSAADRSFEVALRGLKRSAGLRARLSESGSWAGGSYEVMLDLPRLKRVVNRIVRGLFYKSAGRRLSSDYEILTFIGDEHLAFGSHVATEFLKILEPTEPILVGDGEVFGYQFAFPDREEPNLSYWYLCFYNNYVCISMTRRKAHEGSGPRPPYVRLGGILYVYPCGES